MSKLYYEAPTDEIFEEVRNKCVEVWCFYDNTYGYVDEKTSKLKDLKNIQDNLMYMVAMFDIVNQKKLADKLSEESKTAIRKRMIDGGNSLEYIVF